MTPRKRRRGASSRRCRSPLRRKAPPTNDKDDSVDNEEQETPRFAWSDLPANILAQDHAPSDSRSQQVAPQDPSEKYARRPRHKTKVDRYEYKGYVNRKSPAETAFKNKHKRSRRNKTGDTLNQEFKAPNVEQERLTLKASVGPGIFGKGKASALFRTTGLPDLTFSEMTFLSKRQPDLAQPEKQKQSNASKKKDRSKEISGFFAKSQSEAARLRRTSSEVHQSQYSMGPTEWEITPATSSPAKLTSRTELSLVSDVRSNPERHFNQVKQVPRPTDYQANENVKKSNQRRTCQLPPADFAEKPVATMRTSGSWSVTPSRPGSRKQPVDRSAGSEQVPPQSARQSKLTPTRESSITNSSLDRYTKNLLLENYGMSRKSHRVPLGPVVFSLDDLKGLARIAEIEERYVGLPGMNSHPQINLNPGFSSIAAATSAAYGVQPEFGLGKHPAARQLPDGNNTTETMNRTLPAKLGALSPRPLPLRDDQQYQALQRITAPRYSVSVQTEFRAMQRNPFQLDHAQHRNRPVHTSDDDFERSQGYTHGEQQFCYTQQHQSRVPTPFDMIPELDVGAYEEQHYQNVNNEQSHIYQDTARETFGPAMSMLPTVGVLGLEDFPSDKFESNSNVPELDGLLDGEYTGDGMETCGQGSGVQFPDYDDGQVGMSLENCYQDSAEEHTLGSGGDEVLTWNRNSALHSFAGPEQEFQGFSRPQILY